MKKLKNVTESSLTDNELISYIPKDSRDYFLNVLRRYPIPTMQENHELAMEAKKGNHEARNLLIIKNIRLVLLYAYKLRRKLHSFDINDIIQEGNIGLINAIEKYDETRGTFSVCAMQCIKKNINSAIIEKDRNIRFPAYLEQLKNNYCKIRQASEQSGQPMPEDKDLCIILECTMEALLSIKNETLYLPKSLSDFLTGCEDTTIEDTIKTVEPKYADPIDKIYEKELFV